ncbi:tail fiber domain-containing protein [Pantoea agglomerans]|uniref:tail fiber domain-containing protein n=1 Tax=Enterobacter agglomerans TaxID=549 RepID=UPI003C7BE6EA
MSSIFIGNATKIFYNTDAGNNIPNSPTYVNIDELAAFPEVKIQSSVNQYNTYNDEYVGILAANQSIQSVNVVVNYIPDNVTHVFLDSMFTSQTKFQIKVSLYESMTSVIQHYAILSGYVSSATLSGDQNSVVKKTYVFTAEDVIARGTITEMADLKLGDYGVGANGVDIPQYESETPSGNSFIKVPSNQALNPTGTDLLGIANVDNGNTTKLVMTESGTFSLYGKNQSSSWTQILTKPQSDSAYVPMNRTVNGKALSTNITLTPADVSALALTGGTLTGNLNGTTATFSGAVSTGNLTAGTISGTAISGTTGTFTGAVQADSATVTGAITADSITLQTANVISLEVTGSTIAGAMTLSDALTGTTATFSGAVSTGNLTAGTISGTTGTFTDALNGTTGSFTGAVQADSLTLTQQLSVSNGGTGSSTPEAARTALSAAKTGINSDITQLNGISPGLSIRGMKIEEGTEGNGITIESSDPVGSSFGIANVGGGAAVFHNYVKPANGAGQPGDSLIGGYGSRPWTGTTYTAHSNTAIHFMMDGQASSTNHGGWTRIMTCPKDATQDSRRQTFATSNNGDLWVGSDVPMGTNAMAHPSFGGDNSQGWDGRGMKQVVGPYNDINFLTPGNGNTSPSITIRGTPFGGYAGSTKTATPGNSAMWVGLDGHNGNNFVAVAASVRFVPSSGQTWSPTNTGAGIIFSTTAVGSTTRADRWSISGDGQFLPLNDGFQSVGNPSLRLSAVYAVNGSIQTSDARLKTEIRQFNEQEILASKLIAKEIGFFSWLDKQKEEGDSAREHVGFTVQRAIEIMESCNLDPMNYGFICYDSWEERQEVDYYENDTDTPVYKTIPAGDRYSFRYDQLNLFIARGFEARLSALESSLQ